MLAAESSVEKNEVVGDDDNESTASESSVSTVVSLESVKEILTDDEFSESDDEIANESYHERKDDAVIKNEVLPDLNRILLLLSSGRLKLSEQAMKRLQELGIKVDAAVNTSNDLQDKWNSLNNALKDHKKQVNDIKQYIKFDNLLFHNFKLPPKGLTSLEFSHYMAQQINHLIPLCVPVSWHHISDAHRLWTKSKKSNVIIVRFCNRNIRHEIYSNRNLLKVKGLTITEHLTEENLQVLYRAKELFGFTNVFTENCKIFITLNGKIKRVKSIEDVNELFEANSAQHHDSIPNVQRPPRKHQSDTSTNAQASNSLRSNNQVYLHAKRPPHQSYRYNNNEQYNAYNYDMRNTHADHSRHFNRDNFSSNNRGRGRRPAYSVRNRNYIDNNYNHY